MRGVERLLAVLLIAVVGWSVAAFGDVHSWAYVPALAGCLATGAVGLGDRNQE